MGEYTVMWPNVSIIMEQRERCNVINTMPMKIRENDSIVRINLEMEGTVPSLTQTQQQLDQHVRGIHGDGFIAYCGKRFTWPLDRHNHQQECTKCQKIMNS